MKVGVVSLEFLHERAPAGGRRFSRSGFGGLQAGLRLSNPTPFSGSAPADSEVEINRWHIYEFL
eukprot:7870656-Lingulodinium_polyedra.AAC.1